MFTDQNTRCNFTLRFVLRLWVTLCSAALVCIITGCGVIWGGVSFNSAAPLAYNDFQVGAGSSTSTEFLSVAEDQNEIIYSAGLTSGYLGGTLYGAHGSLDGLIYVYSRTAGPLWSAQLGEAGATVVATGVVLDGLGNVYIAGHTSAYLGGIQIGTNSASDEFVAKFTTTGTLVWISQLGVNGSTTTVNSSQPLIVDTLGNPIVTGVTGGNFVPFTGVQTGVHGANDFLVAKLSTSGNLTWLSQVGGATINYPSIAVSPTSSNIVATMQVSAGSIAGATQYGTHSNTGDIGLMQFNQAGVYQSTSQYGMATFISAGTSLAIDNSGNIAVAGLTRAVLTGGTQYGTHGLQDIALVKFSGAGSWIWSSQLGGSTAYAQGVVVDSGGNFVITGTSNGLVGGTLYGSHTAEFDIVVAKFNTTGTMQWASQLGQGGASSAGWGIAVGADGLLTVAGYINSGVLGGLQFGTHASSGLDGTVSAFDANGLLK